MESWKQNPKSIGLAIAAVLAIVAALPSVNAGPSRLVHDLKDCALDREPINCLLDIYCEGQRLPNVNVERCHFVDGWCVGTIIPTQTLTSAVDGVKVIGNVYVVADDRQEDFGVFAYQGQSDAGYEYAFLGFSAHCV